MSDLVEFLRARLAEDEQLARAASERHAERWRIDDDGETLLLWDPMPDTWGMGQTMNGSVTAHIARHDPARVLRGVEAKQRLVELYEAQIETGGFVGTFYANAAEPSLRLLALPYADCPDYREEWRP